MAKAVKDNDSFQELKKELRSKIHRRLYFFYGEETFLLRHYLEMLKKQRIDPVTESFNFHRFTQESFDLRSFADSVENLPMMSESTMVQVDEVDPFKLEESGRNAMVDILTDIPEYCTVVFLYETTPWKPDKRQKKLWEAVSSAGTIVEFEKQGQKELVAWITRHFAAGKKRISPDLCTYLMELTGGTMTALNNEIAKITAYSGAEEICKADIDAVVEPVMDAVVFQMTDLLGQGRYGQALEKLQQLLKMQEEPVMILGAIGAHIRRLGAARTLYDYGKNHQDLAKLYGMSDFAARKTMDISRNFSTAFCRESCMLVMETDRKLKTSFDDPQRLLEMLILQMAQEARNG